MIYQLSQQEYRKYFHEPMRLVGEDEDVAVLNLEDYVAQFLIAQNLSVELDAISVQHVYEDPVTLCKHLLLSFGIENFFIVLIAEVETILGYHMLDLKEKYDL